MMIMICGYGFVGQAHALALSNGNEIAIYDPAKGYGNFWRKPDAVIIAVSTPMAKDGSCEMGNVYDILPDIDDSVPILIKSTISLEGWELITRAFPDNKITFSPEFLRAEHAMQDFRNQQKIYIGGGDEKFWSDLLSNALGADVVSCDPKELILMKYFRNAFLATKVAFFNQVYDMCIAAGVEPNQTLSLIVEDPRIGTSHSYVTKERGFGGHCFPKDTSAIVKSAKDIGVELSLIEEAINYNNRIRK